MIPWACGYRNLLLLAELVSCAPGTTLPQPVEKPPAAHLDVQVALGGEVLQHLIRLVYREGGLHRRLRGRQLPAPLQCLQELALPGISDGGLVVAFGEARDAPHQQPEGGEDHPPE